MTPEARRLLLALYEEVDRKVEAASPVCAISGRCCDFPRSEHRLYATALEATVAREDRAPDPPEQPGWCPFYRQRLCTLRELRPLGCRTYFCDPVYGAATMASLAEWSQTEVRAIHRQLDLPYRYAPFVDLLAAEDSR